MSAVLDTGFIPPQDREEVLRHALWESMAAVDVDHRPPAEDISARVGLDAVGPLRILSAGDRGHYPSDGAAGPGRQRAVVFLGLQMAGTSLVVQNDRQCLPHAEAVVEPSVELLRAVLTSQGGRSDLARGPLEATRSLRITQYIRKHLADPDLSAARIAAAHGISVRHLYAVLSRSGISLGDWIRTHRLTECRRELADPSHRLRTIAAIGRRWGFVDATHFSKVFKQAYEISPRAWRDQNHPRAST